MGNEQTETSDGTQESSSVGVESEKIETTNTSSSEDAGIQASVEDLTTAEEAAKGEVAG